MKQNTIIIFMLAWLCAISLKAQQQTGTLTVTCDHPTATVWVDGTKVGFAPQTLTLSGNHNIRVEDDVNYYYRYTQMHSFTPGMNENLDVTLKAMPRKVYPFVIGQYGFGGNDLGIMVGVCGTWGGYVRYHSNFGKEISAHSHNQAVITRPMPVKKLEKPYSMGLTAGIMRYIAANVYAYAGGGYYKYAPGSYPDTGYVPYTIYGACAEVGAIYKYKALLVSAGYGFPIADKQVRGCDDASWGDFHIGVGITIHKNLKR